MSQLLSYAKTEIENSGFLGKDSGYNGMIGESVLELIDVFSKQEHSGSSADIVIDIFKTLSKYQPLSPLTGADDEWMEVGSGVFQNKRCATVFKDKRIFDGKAYDINGKIFRTPSGACYTSNNSKVLVDFPYTPKSEYVEVLE